MHGVEMRKRKADARAKFRQNPVTTRRGRRMHASRGKRLFWAGLIVGSWLVALAVPLYNRVEPRLAGIPFFYWFQFLWIIVAAILTALAYRARV